MQGQKVRVSSRHFHSNSRKPPRHSDTTRTQSKGTSPHWTAHLAAHCLRSQCICQLLITGVSQVIAGAGQSFLQHLQAALQHSDLQHSGETNLGT